VKRFSAILFILFSFLSSTFSQNDPTQKQDGHWNTLALVTFESHFDEDFGIDVQKPIVSPVAKSLEGKEIEVSGYIIPLTGKLEQSHFMLSRYPQSMCFFCGKAGPESAMQVFTLGGKKIPFTEDKITVKGTLRINETDVTNLLYTLENGVVLK